MKIAILLLDTHMATILVYNIRGCLKCKMLITIYRYTQSALVQDRTHGKNDRETERKRERLREREREREGGKKERKRQSLS